MDRRPYSPTLFSPTPRTTRSVTGSPRIQNLETRSSLPAVDRPKTFYQWVATARAATLEVLRDGSPSPFAWILVEDKNIPENAIVGGEDRRKPLYIARSFFEGGIYIGKAGHHLRLGAAIPYNGREIEVATYEVLVSAQQPIRYTFSGPTQIVNGDNEALRYLNEIKTVILVDDSMSMAGVLWHDAREALAGVAELASKYGADGVDVFFLNSDESGLELKDGQQVRSLFDSVEPDGQTPTGEKLQEICNIYIPRLEDPRNTQKPIAIIVITDGVPTDDPKQVIIDAARRLDQSHVPLNQFGIQFAQIGDDEDATEALRELDDGIAEANGIRDMVDTTPFNPKNGPFTTATMTKILLGAIDRTLDSDAVPDSQARGSKKRGNNY